MNDINFFTGVFNNLECLKGENKYKTGFKQLQTEIKDQLRTAGKDMRYKVKFLASTTSYRSFIFSYQGRKYYAYNIVPEDKYIIELS